jgi:hypothetical protein
LVWLVFRILPLDHFVVFAIPTCFHGDKSNGKHHMLYSHTVAHETH